MIVKEPENDAERQAFIAGLPSHLRFLGSLDHLAILLGAWAGDCLIGRLAAIAASNDPESYKLQFLLAAESQETGVLPSQAEVRSALLAEFEARARALGYRKLVMQPFFRVGTNHASVLLDSLRQQQWDEIRYVGTRFHIKGYGVLQERWFHTPLPPGYEIFFWRDLTPEDREYVKSRKDEAGYLDPFRVEHFEPQSSIGLRNTSTGQVAGWFVNELANPSTVRFSRLYLFREARSQACFYPFLAHSVRHV